MKTSLVERTPGAGRQANFSSGMASASASKGRALNNRRNAKSTFLMVGLVSGSLVLNFGKPFYTQSEDGIGGRVAPLIVGAARRFDQRQWGRGRRARRAWAAHLPR